MHKAFSPWLLSSKVSPPRISINASRRDRLLELLSRNIDKRIIVLEAPAGFGKTLLLSQWREGLGLEGNCVAWLSINQNDQPDVLLPYIAFAFHQAGLDTEQTGLLYPSHKQGDSSYLLGSLLSLVEQSDRKCVMVFDDFENITADSLAEITEPLVALQPEKLQLVFACRKNPGLSLSSLAVEGNVLNIGPQQLMFDKREVTHFFRNKLGNRELDNIMERTGGWPVALQLIRSFGAGPDETPGKPEVTANNRLIAEYFREQLINKLSEEEQSFLLQTSMLEAITADCANAIRERKDANEIMHGLDYLEGIFSPLDDEQEAWRVHPLVKEYLLNELKESSLEEYRSLCRKVATWMAGQSRGLEAMRFALSAEDPAYAAEILEQMGGVMLWIREGMSRLTSGLRLLEEYELDGYPRIHLGRCLLHTKSGDINRAREAFEKARRVSNDFSSDRRGGDDTLLQIERYSIEIMLAEYGCTPAHPILPADAFQFMLEHTSEEPSIHGYIKTLQCLTSLQMGEFDDCIRHGQHAIREYLTGNSLYGELFIYFYFGMAEQARGRTTAALGHYNKAVQISHSGFPGDTGLKLLGNAILGEYYWERGDTANTKKHIKHVIKNIGDMEAYFDIYMAAYQSAVGYLLFEKGLKEALKFLDDALANARQQSLDRLEEFLLYNRLSVLYFAGEENEVRMLLGDRPQLFNQSTLSLPNRTWRELESLSLATARVARLLGEFEYCDALLMEATGIAGETRNLRLLIKLRIQSALNALQQGQTEAALQGLVTAVSLASEGNYLRPFLNEQKHLAKLFDAATKYFETGGQRERDQQFLLELVKTQKQQKPVPGGPAGFSAREIQILSELSQGQPDKLIARQTGLSAHGVRYHLKNIYSKMGVENRVQAISQAREMGLL